MRELLIRTTEIAVLVIDSMALLIVVVGTVMAFVGAVKIMLVP
jgi:hypothetical protein